MALQVIGAGLGRTGTHSLKLALEHLGFAPCYHMIEILDLPEAQEKWLKALEENLADWDDIFAGYNATTDFPACIFYYELAQYYPNAKVILSLRDTNEWLESTQRTIFADLDKLSPQQNDLRSRMAMAALSRMFDGKYDRPALIAGFERHNDMVKRTIPPERLLVYNIAEGWEPLCRFLEKPVPDRPFPKTNTTEDFHALRAAREKAGKRLV